MPDYTVTSTHEFMGYTIVEKRDFPKDSPMSGFVVTKNGANPMPGACWFDDVQKAKKGIAAYVLACKIAPVTYDGGIQTCEPGIFWMLMELVK